MREQKTKAQVKKTSVIIPTSCPPTHTLIGMNHPPPIPSPHRLKQYNGHRIPGTNETI